MFLRIVRAEDGATDGPLEFVAATPGTKRDGLDLAELPWRLDNYVRNPIVTWAHDLRGDRLPIGRAEVTIDKGGDGEVMRASIIFDEADEFAASVARKYRAGFLHAVSVTWDDVDDKGLSKRAGGGKAAYHELLEIAAVPVPGDQDALIERQRAALINVRDALSEALDEEVAEVEPPVERAADDRREAGVDLLSGSMRWDGQDGVSYEIQYDPATAKVVKIDNPIPETVERAVGVMLAAMSRDDVVPDDWRRSTYNRAEAMYRRLGLDAPEFVTGAELRDMDDETWRGLFLSGEIPAGERAGAVLSRKNVTRLQNAGRMIREVLDSAGSEIGGGEEKEDKGRAIEIEVDEKLGDLERLRAALFGGLEDGE